MNELKEILESNKIELSLISMSGGSTESCTDNINCIILSSCSGCGLCSGNGCQSGAGSCGTSPACGGNTCTTGADRECGGTKTCTNKTCQVLACTLIINVWIALIKYREFL